MNNEIPRKTTWLATIMAAVLAACSGPAPQVSEEAAERAEPSAESVRAEEPTLADVQAVGVPGTAMPFENVVTAGQPTEEQMAALVDLGFTNFVSLRPATEEGAGWEEGIAPDEGIHFERIPVAGAEGLTRENVQELDRVLDEAGEESTVLYCSTSNRVGALLALRAYWLEGAEPQAALELGRRAGLSRLEPAVSELLAAPR